ncbi:MAG: HK97 gp10 family phage protein [Chloroflexota bacterium]
MAKPIRATSTVDTAGIREVAKLSQQRTATLKAVKAGGKIVAAAAKARAPRRPGRGGGGLKQAMGVKGVKGTRGKTLAYAVIGARKKVVKMVAGRKGGKLRKHVPAYIAHIVEGGAKAHGLNGGTHPGAKAKPFLGPAFDAAKDKAMGEAQRVLGAETMKLVEKAAAKLAKGKGR